MNTVEDLKEKSNCFLTPFWRKSKFMLISKLESQTTKEVTRIFKRLDSLILCDDYKRLFRFLFIDNYLYYSLVKNTLIQIEKSYIFVFFYSNLIALHNITYLFF